MIRTKKKTLAVLATGLLLASLPGSAQARSPRSESGTYLGGGIQGVIGVSGAGQENLGAVRFEGGTERFVSVVVEDANGLPVAGEVAQNLDSDTSPEVSYMFCGETEKPLKIKPGVEVIVYVYEGTCGSSPSLPTTGEVTAEFSARR